MWIDVLRCSRPLSLALIAVLFGACAFVNSVRQPRPIRIICEGSRLDLYQKAKGALEKHNYKIRVDNRVEGVLKAYRTPEQVHFGDQTIFNGALYVETVIDSVAVTLFIYRVMEIPAEGREPAIEVSYDEKNSTLYTRPLFQPLLDDLRRACANLK